MTTEDFKVWYEKMMAMRHPEVARLLEEVKIKVKKDFIKREEDHLA
jgi:ABC-type proline/glycine betaine transport system substrate-binding protein